MGHLGGDRVAPNEDVGTKAIAPEPSDLHLLKPMWFTQRLDDLAADQPAQSLMLFSRVILVRLTPLAN